MCDTDRSNPLDEDPHFLLAPQDVWDHIERHHPRSNGQPRDRALLDDPRVLAWAKTWLDINNSDRDDLTDAERVARALHEASHYAGGEDHARDRDWLDGVQTR